MSCLAEHFLTVGFLEDEKCPTVEMRTAAFLKCCVRLRK